MKKKLIALVLMLALVLTIGLVACDKGSGVEGKEVTLTHGEVGVENHSYFPYATATVKGTEIKSLEMGEAFGPTGKLVVETQTGTPANAYRNPWYPGVSGLATAYTTLGRTAVEALPLADRHFIKIGERIFVLTITTGNQDLGSVRAINVLVFREYKTGETAAEVAAAQVLHDRYLAANMEWYITAIKANKVFACDSTGTKRAAASATINGTAFDFSKCPNDGAFLKNDSAAVYNAGRGLQGDMFTKAMKLISDYIVSKNGKIEFEYSASGGNWNNVRIKGLDFTAYVAELVALMNTATPPAAIVTQASSKSADTYLRYGASYAQVALTTIQLAINMSFTA